MPLTFCVYRLIRNGSSSRIPSSVLMSSMAVRPMPLIFPETR